MPDQPRLAFVTPRYGDDVVGGSEAVMREVAHGLAKRGWAAEVLTTCATSHYTWENVHPPGATRDGDVVVRRFPTVHDGDRARRDAVERRIQAGLPVSLDEQFAWLHGTFRVPDLFHHLVVEERSYDAVVLSPYLFWTTVCCSLVAPGKTVIVPCLHDETYAYLDIFRPVLAGAAQLWFLSEPEHELAHRLADLADHAVTGAGMDDRGPVDEAAARSLAGTDRPFVYFAGRREGGKGWDDLVRALERAVLDHGAQLALVTTGVGVVDVPPGLAGHVIDLGFVTTEQRDQLMSAAAAYVQPSANESFSRTVMEAWLAGTGVIANGASAVVAWHCERSGAGVVYEGHDELVAALLLLDDDPTALDDLAAAGRDYVLREYGWDAVLDRIEEALGRVVKR